MRRPRRKGVGYNPRLARPPEKTTAARSSCPGFAPRGGRHGGAARHFPAPAAAPREGARRPSRDPREGPRHLAGLDLVAGGRRGARARVRPRRAGVQARHEPRDRRREPAAPVLGRRRRAVPRRHPDPALFRRRRGGDGVRLPERRDRVRDRRGPGAGRQAARGQGGVPEARAHLLRRRARAAELRPARARELREPAGRRPRVRRTQPRLLPRRGREGSAVGYRRDVLHLGHHRPAEGRGPHPREPHHRRPHGRRDGRAHARRGGARVHAARLDRAEHLLVRAALRRRLLRLLPRVRRDGDGRHARDRADVLLRGAARAGGAAHAGDDPDGGRERAQARDVPLLHGARAARRREDPRREGAGGPRRPAAVPDRRRPRLRAVAERARHEPGADRLHRGRSDRARPLRLLPFDRHQPQAALRLDRDLGVRVRAAERPGEGRHRRPAGERRRDQGDRRRARSSSARRGSSRAITRTPRRPPRRRRTTAGSIPATPATSTRTATSRSSTARRTSGG